MTSKLVEKIRNIVFPILGVVFILLSDHVTRILPYLLGGAMVLTAILWGINAFQNRNLALEHPEGFTSGIVWMIMGVAFILQGSNALGAIGTTWAMIGIGKASKSLKQAIRRLCQKQHFAIPMIEFLLRMTLALLLLFHPFEKFSTHIIILGLELIAVSIRLPQSLSFGNNSKDKKTPQ
ncbi:MAG: DUF308 domain-containing protein [Agathobacter sp.]